MGVTVLVLQISCVKLVPDVRPTVQTLLMETGPESYMTHLVCVLVVGSVEIVPVATVPKPGS